MLVKLIGTGVGARAELSASMTLSPTAEAAWQEHRLTLPLADFPAEIFDPQIDEFWTWMGALIAKKIHKNRKMKAKAVSLIMKLMLALMRPAKSGKKKPNVATKNRRKRKENKTSNPNGSGNGSSY